MSKGPKRGNVRRECPICDKTFNGKRGLMQHLRLAHIHSWLTKEGRVYECWCGQLHLDFGAHITRSGGITKHWWEHALNLTPEK